MAETIGRRRLLVISERFYPEQFLVNELVEEFVAAGFEVTVLTQAPSYPFDKVYKGFSNQLLQQSQVFGARVLRVRTVLGYKKSLVKRVMNYVSFALLASVALLLKGRHYESAFVFQTGPLTQGLPLILVKGARNRRCIWSQDIWPDTVYEYGFRRGGLTTAVVSIVVAAVYRSCDWIAITSPGFSDSVRRYAPARTRLIYVPQWVPQELLLAKGQNARPSQSAQRSIETRFCFAGNIGSMQNLYAVVRAFGKARRSRPELFLEIIGDGSEKQRLAGIVKMEKLTGISFKERIPMAEIMPRLQGSDFLVLPLVGDGTVAKTIPAKFQAYLAARQTDTRRREWICGKDYCG